MSIYSLALVMRQNKKRTLQAYSFIQSTVIAWKVTLEESLDQMGKTNQMGSGLISLGYGLLLLVVQN